MDDENKSAPAGEERQAEASAQRRPLPSAAIRASTAQHDSRSAGKSQKEEDLDDCGAALALVAIVVGMVAVNAKPKGRISKRCTTSIAASFGRRWRMTEAISLPTLIPLIVRRIEAFISLKRIRQLRTSTRLLALTSRFTREWNELTLWRACRARLATA